MTGWFAVSCGWETTLLVLGAAALHELGHILCLRRFGAPIRRLRIGVLGAVLETGGTMSYGRELAAVLAGPLANLLAAVLLGWLGYPVSAGANAVLGAFNLLPVSPLDGGRALYLLLVWLAGPETAEWGCRCVRDGVADVAHRRKHLAAPGGCGASDCGVENAAAWRNRLNLSLSLEL